MPTITLPDGSQRSFDHPVSVAEVAASIGAGLAKATVAGKVNGKPLRNRCLSSQAVIEIENIQRVIYPIQSPPN